MNKKLIIGIVVVIIVAILGVFMFLSSSDVTLIAKDASVTLPSNYTIDDQGVAYAGDVGVSFSPVSGVKVKDVKALFDTLKSKGSSSGYKKVTTDKVNGFKLYEYSANPDKLKKVSSDKVTEGNYETWKDYEPVTPFDDFSDMDVVNFRYVTYVNEDSKDISELYIFTNNTDVDLYSNDINDIIESIAVVEK